MFSTPRRKLIGGTVLLLFGVAWYIPAGPLNALADVSSVGNLQALLIIVQGWAGLVALLVGVFVVWMARDEQVVLDQMAGEEPVERSNTVRIDDKEYDEIVTQDIDTVKDAVVDDDLDVGQVIAAEKRSQDRDELIAWLERLQ